MNNNQTKNNEIPSSLPNKIHKKTPELETPAIKFFILFMASFLIVILCRIFLFSPEDDYEWAMFLVGLIGFFGFFAPLILIGCLNWGKNSAPKCEHDENLD